MAEIPRENQLQNLAMPARINSSSICGTSNNTSNITTPKSPSTSSVVRNVSAVTTPTVNVVSVRASVISRDIEHLNASRNLFSHTVFFNSFELLIFRKN